MRIALVADADQRESMRCIRSIAGQTSMSALGVASWEELERALEGVTPIALLVYGMPLPGAPADALARLPELALQVVLVGELPPEQDHLRRDEHFSILPRPISEENLVLVARRAGSQSGVFQANFAPVDFLQMLCASGDSHTLIVSREGEDMGIIEVRGGYVWTAFDAVGVGEDAFARLVRPEMRARVRNVAPSKKERTVFKDLQELLLESIRRIDEGEIAAPPPLTEAQIKDALASPEELAAQVKDLTAQAQRLLLTRNYNEAVKVLQRLSELDSTSSLVRANLEQLRRLGYPR